MRLKEIDDVDGGFCRAYVVVRFVTLDFVAAMGTGIAVEAGVGVTESYLPFEIPVLSENPGIAVADSPPANQP